MILPSQLVSFFITGKEALETHDIQMSVEWQYYRGILINDHANVNAILILHISWYNSLFIWL